MKRGHLMTVLFLAGVVLLTDGSTALGDILEMKDGRLLQGAYLGGSQNSVRFEGKDGLVVVPVDQILSLTFDRKAGAAPAEAKKAEGKVEEPSSGAVTILAGTALLVRTADLIDSSKHGSGYRFTTKLETDLVVSGKVVAKKGTTVYGVLTSAKKGKRLAGKAELRLELTDILINNQRYKLQSGGFAIQGEGQGTGKKVAAGAAVGQLWRGNSKSTKRGAAVGLTASVLSSKQIRVAPGTLLEFQLSGPTTIQ